MMKKSVVKVSIILFIGYITACIVSIKCDCVRQLLSEYINDIAGVFATCMVAITLKIIDEERVKSINKSRENNAKFLMGKQLELGLRQVVFQPFERINPLVACNIEGTFREYYNELCQLLKNDELINTLIEVVSFISIICDASLKKELLRDYNLENGLKIIVDEKWIPILFSDYRDSVFEGNYRETLNKQMNDILDLLEVKDITSNERSNDGLLTLPRSEYSFAFDDEKISIEKNSELIFKGTFDRAESFGEISYNIASGYGKLDNYVGEFLNGCRSGKGTEFWKNGKEMKEGRWEAGGFVEGKIYGETGDLVAEGTFRCDCIPIDGNIYKGIYDISGQETMLIDIVVNDNFLTDDYKNIDTLMFGEAHCKDGNIITDKIKPLEDEISRLQHEIQEESYLCGLYT